MESRLSVPGDGGRYHIEEVNPYTPPDAGLEEPVTHKRKPNHPSAKSVRTFAIAVFAGMLLAGPFAITQPIETLTRILTFGLIAVWVDRVLSR